MAADTAFAPASEPTIETMLHLRTVAASTGAASTGSANLGALPQGIAAALRELAAGDVGELELTAAVLASDGPDGVLRLQLLLRRLDAAGQVERGVRAGGRTLARLRPVGRGRTPWTTALPPAQPVKLSRFAVVRVEDGHLVAQAPRSHTLVELSPEAGWLLGALARWTTPAELSTVEASTPWPAPGAGAARRDRRGDPPAAGRRGPARAGRPRGRPRERHGRPGPVGRARPVAAQPQPGAAAQRGLRRRLPDGVPVPAAAGPRRAGQHRAGQHRAGQHRAGQHRAGDRARRPRRGQGPAAERGAGTAPVHPRARRLRAGDRRSARRAAVPDDAAPVHLHHRRRAGGGRPSVPVRRRRART